MTIASIHQKFQASTGVSTDTRSVRQGNLFFALKGPTFNANLFAQEALKIGAAYAVVDDPAVVSDERYILVQDALKTLQDLAYYHRSTFGIPVIAITGTNGKTTTKELTQAVLGSDRPTLATLGNLNNHIGVPLTLLRLQAEHRIAIIEMGANKPGDIAELCSIAAPTHGMITNIGKAHLEGFGSYEGVMRTKTELYRYVQEQKGCLFVNADDALLMEQSVGIERFTYGRSPWSNTVGRATGKGPFLGLAFQGRDMRDHDVKTKLIGDYNLQNALAAIAVGQHLGVADTRIARALEDYTPGNNRSQFSDTGKNQLILDLYNANPTSMAAALRNFAAMTTDRPKLAILGDMLELGADSESEHRAVVDLAKRLELQCRFVGPEFGKANAGLSGAQFSTAELLREALAAEGLRSHLILLKGSRGIRLEQVLPAL